MILLRSGFVDHDVEQGVAGLVGVGAAAHAGVEGVDARQLVRGELEVEDVEVLRDAGRVDRLGDDP